MSAAPIKGNREESSSHRVYPVYHISMYAKRKGLYYFWNLTLVLVRKFYDLLKVIFFINLFILLIENMTKKQIKHYLKAVDTIGNFSK